MVYAHIRVQLGPSSRFLLLKLRGSQRETLLWQGWVSNGSKGQLAVEWGRDGSMGITLSLKYITNRSSAQIITLNP